MPEGMGLLPDWPGVERRGWYYLYGVPRGRSIGGWRQTIFCFTRIIASIVSFNSAGDFLIETRRGAAPRNGARRDAPLRQTTERADRRRDAREAMGSEAEDPQPLLTVAFGLPPCVTDARGQAAVEVAWPDNLTRWRAYAVGATTSAQVGSGARMSTRKDRSSGSRPPASSSSETRSCSPPMSITTCRIPPGRLFGSILVAIPAKSSLPRAWHPEAQRRQH